MMYGQTLDAKRELPRKLSGESYDGSGPALPHCQPLSTAYVEQRGYDPDDYRGTRPMASRIPRSQGSILGGVPPTATQPQQVQGGRVEGRTGKGSWFDRIRNRK